ncbi:MAG: succinylglutamate desuccinylase/aspartoacylase family protein [Candidatus Vogelbacteria bacterium]|nr:succinylglutamate desuccinylase/aspartoacylase family protein [Candidatus Vogelbacteria bacterium]
MSLASQPKILLIIGTHGDEGINLETIEKLKNYSSIKEGDFDVLIGNPEALRRNERFIEADLNRVYPGIKDSSVYEENQAWQNLEKASEYDYVLDLHIAPKSRDSFIIIPEKEIKNISLVKSVNIDKVVLWPSTSNRPTGPICQFLDNSLEIEFGTYGKTDDEVVTNAAQIIAETLKNLLNTDQISNPLSQKVFLVYGKLMAEEIKNEMLLDFKLAKVNNEEFYPLLTDQYLPNSIKCYKMRLVKTDL